MSTAERADLHLCEPCRRIWGGRPRCPLCGGPLQLAGADRLLGETFGRHRLEEVRGIGGMGIVYRAVHTTLGRDAALKVVLPHGDDDAFERRFRREAQVLAGLRHPNLVEVFDFDVSSWGLPYYLMEYLEGVSLREELSAGRRWRREEALPVLGAIGEGLRHAHSRGVVHRDLKPENVFLARYGEREEVKILDFGIAKVLRPEEEATRLTGTGQFVGTPHYLAPEQVLDLEIGPWTDQYALALIAAEMLSGRSVRSGHTLATILSREIHRPLGDDVLAACGVEEEGRVALRRAASPAVGDRFPSVEAFLEALAGGANLGVTRRIADTREGLPLPTPTPEDHPTVATPAPAADVGRRFEGRKGRGRIAILVAGAFLVAGAVGLWQWLARPGEEAPAGRGDAVVQAAGWSRAEGWGVPPDVRRIWGTREDTVVLEGQGAVILWRAGVEEPPARVALGEGERILGRDAEGALLLFDGQRLRWLDPFRGAELRWPDAPEGEGIWISSDGRHLLRTRGDELTIYRRLEDGWRRVGSEVVGEVRALQVGATTASVLAGGQLRWISLAEGRERQHAVLGDLRGLSVLAHFEAGRRTAVGGFDDRIRVVTWEEGGDARIEDWPSGGRVFDQQYFPDGPSLLVAGMGGLKDFDSRSGEGALLIEGRVENLYREGATVWALDVESHRLWRVEWEGGESSVRPLTEGAEIWDLAVAPGGGGIFAGSSDGSLYRVADEGGAAGARKVHTLGITSLVATEGFAATASDDRTIAVWRLPSLEVVWRSHAHDYLINDLFLDGELWSASSDGSVKRWSFPALEERGSVDVSALVGRELSLASVWARDDGSGALAGSWNGALISLRGDGDRWVAQEHPFPSQAVYRLLELPSARAVLAVGVMGHPVLALYDLDLDRVLVLPELETTFFAAAADASASVAWVVGEDAVLRLSVTREPACGRLAVSGSVVLDSRWGSLLSVALDPEHGVLLVGDGEGRIHRIALQGEELGGEIPDSVLAGPCPGAG